MVWRRITSILLATVLTALPSLAKPQASSSFSIEEKIRAIQPNSPVEVRLHGGTKLRGAIGEVSATGYVLTQDQSDQSVSRSLTFQETRSVKNVDSVNPGHGSKHIFTAIAIGMIAVAVIAVVLLLKNRG